MEFIFKSANFIDSNKKSDACVGSYVYHNQPNSPGHLNSVGCLIDSDYYYY